MQDSFDDDASAGSGVVDGQDNNPTREDPGEVHVGDEHNAQMDPEYFDKFRQTTNGRKRDPAGTRSPFHNSVNEDTPDGDEFLPFPPPEASGQYAGSRDQTPVNSGGNDGTVYEER